MITIEPHWDYPWVIKGNRVFADEEWIEFHQWWNHNIQSGYLTASMHPWIHGYIFKDEEALAFKLRWT